MAVYTALPADALDAWLAMRGVGTLVECEGIAAGIENSNFFVTTRIGDTTRRFVLTLFERLALDELPYYLSLMRHLATQGVVCPAPVPDRTGSLCGLLAGKPAALVTRLEGRSIVRPTPDHCAAAGRTLARMHRAATTFETAQPNPRGVDWWIATAGRVRDVVGPTQRALLDDEIALQRSSWARSTDGLPRSAIHADLFRDNALFVDAPEAAVAGCGVIDFYFAGDDAWVLDLAICLNDWCIDLDDGAFDRSRLAAFVGAYDGARALTAAERTFLPQALRAAALRFWLSRLDDFHRPRPAQLLTPHDPTHFERVLRRRRDEAIDGRDPLDPTSH
jgi:homoserine kinase type II